MKLMEVCFHLIYLGLFLPSQLKADGSWILLPMNTVQSGLANTLFEKDVNFSAVFSARVHTTLTAYRFYLLYVMYLNSLKMEKVEDSLLITNSHFSRRVEPSAIITTTMVREETVISNNNKIRNMREVKKN